MVTIPLIRTETDANVTPIERTALACEQVITALMMQATLMDPTISNQGRTFKRRWAGECVLSVGDRRVDGHVGAP